MKILYLSIIVISLILIGTSNSSTAHVEIPQISTSQSNFTDGDIIPINGYALPNSTIHIFLVNNHGNIQNSTQVKSNNNTGYFNTSLGIPPHVIGGAWTLFATDGEGNFAMQLMVNFHGSNTPPFHSPGGFPPLEQFKLGIKSSDVQCRSDLRLIIKSEDGSPACVKFSTAESLIQHGWASSESGISSDGQKTYVIQDSSVSSTPCDTPYVLKTPDISPLFPNDTQITTRYLPVFFMPTNSTGIICVHYANSNTPSPGYARIFDAQNLSKNADDVSISPSEIQVPTGVTNTTFTIKSGNAGFYGIGFSCGGLPLAVGYGNNLVKDDFPWWDKSFSCPAMVYSSDITGTRGIGVHYIPEVAYSKIDYNITGTSVSSVHLSSTIQNVTFTLNVHTFNDSATFWFDTKDSNYIKFNGDPKLEQEGSDPCTWSFTNSNAVTDENQWYKMVGKVTVTDRPITIPPHTNANYTFSILAKNLDAGYYGFNPVFYGRPIDSTVPLENMGGGSVGSYYPVIMGLDKYLDPSGICSR